MHFKNSIGTIYDNTIIFSKIPDKIFKINEISHIEIKEIKLKSFNNFLYSLVIILLFFDLYGHYSGLVNSTIRGAMFVILFIAINFKLKNRQIELVYKNNNEIKIPIKNKEYMLAINFINQFELSKCILSEK